MRRLQEIRKVDIKALSKIHRDRDELVRVKREVASAVVEKGVNERVKLTQLYENKRDEIILQQEIVSNTLNDQKQKVSLNMVHLVLTVTYLMKFLILDEVGIGKRV